MPYYLLASYSLAFSFQAVLRGQMVTETCNRNFHFLSVMCSDLNRQLKAYSSLSVIAIFKKTFNLFLESREGREKERMRNIDVRRKRWLVASRRHPDQDQTRNAGTCPDWELEQPPFTSQDAAPPSHAGQGSGCCLAFPQCYVFFLPQIPS